MLREHLDESHRRASRPSAERALVVDWLSARLGIGEGTHLLDLTCGPGLYAVEFAARGAYVTGIDFAPASIAHARWLADTRRVSERCNFVEADVRNVGLGSGGFDAAIVLYGQLTVFPPAEMLALLEKLAAALGQGGRLAVEILDGDRLDREDQRWWESGTGGIWGDGPWLTLGERHFDAEAAALVDRYHVLHADSGALDVVTVSDQVYGSAAIQDLLVRAGFSDVEVIPAWDGLGLPDASRWLVCLAAVA